MSRTQTARTAVHTAAERLRLAQALLADRSTRIDARTDQLHHVLGATRESSRRRAEIQILCEDASDLVVEVAPEERAAIDAFQAGRSPVGTDDVLAGLTARVTEASVRSALREQTVTATVAAFATADYEVTERLVAEDGSVTLLLSNTAGRAGTVTVADLDVSDRTGEEPAVVVSVDVDDPADAVEDHDDRADDPCVEAGLDAVAVHRHLRTASGLAFGPVRQVRAATRGVERADRPGISTKRPAGSRTRVRATDSRRRSAQ